MTNGLPHVSRDAIRQKLSRQLGASEELLKFAWENRPRHRVTGGPRFEDVLVSIYARSTLTYWGVIHLCEGGFSHQADMLSRSLFEDMVIAHWGSLPEHRDQVIARLQDQHDHNRLLWNDVAKRHSWLEEVAVDLGELEERRSQLDALFGKFGNRPWTGVNMHDMVEEIEPLWTSEQGKRGLWSYYDVMHRLNNLKLHMTATSLSLTTRREADSVRFLMRPSEDEYELTRTLASAFWAYAQLLSLVLDELMPKAKQEFAERNEAWQLEFLPPPSEEEARRTGRNDPCPCGSGRKYKRCHGAG